MNQWCKFVHDLQLEQQGKTGLSRVDSYLDSLDLRIEHWQSIFGKLTLSENTLDLELAEVVSLIKVAFTELRQLIVQAIQQRTTLSVRTVVSKLNLAWTSLTTLIEGEPNYNSLDNPVYQDLFVGLSPSLYAVSYSNELLLIQEVVNQILEEICN